jgi:hypothetical protein
MFANSGFQLEPGFREEGLHRQSLQHRTNWIPPTRLWWLQHWRHFDHLGQEWENLDPGIGKDPAFQCLGIWA